MSVSSISERLIQQRKELWETRVLSDITLKAGNKLFPVHKVLLAMASDYFMAMLTSNMVETTSNEIELKGVTDKGLEPILKYIYTSDLPLTTDNICDIVMAATHLQMDSVLLACMDKMDKVINAENCVDLKNIAKMCSLEDMEYKAEDFLLDNFASVMTEGSHCRLDLRALLLCYFHERSDNTDAVLIGPEKKVFSLLMEWIKHGDDDRMKDVDRVMEVVRFPLMTLEDIESALVEFPALKTNTACQKYIEDARHYLSCPPNQQVLLQSRKTRIRNDPSVVTLSAHPDTGQILFHALCLQGNFNPVLDNKKNKAKWLHVVDVEDDIPNITMNSESVSSIVINDFLILVGVHDKTADKDNPPQACYLFDPRFFKWTKLANMVKGRHRPALAFHGECLYAFGGAASLTERTNLDSTECYSFKDDSWKEAKPMLLKLRNHAACTLNDQIFICGGRREDTTLSNAVFTFTPKTQSFEKLYPMPSPCENHQIYNIKDKIFMALPKQGLIKTYQDDVMTWQKFWVRLGGPKIPEDGQAVQVNGYILFINGVLDNDYSESDSDDSDWERFPETERACVEVVLGDTCRGQGHVYVHDDYPAGLSPPLVLAGLRLPWTLTKSVYNTEP